MEGSYFVEVLSNSNQIRLYKSRSFIPISDYEEFEPLSAGSGTHTFSLTGILNQKIGAQRLFRKFPLEPNNTNSTIEKTIPGPTGLLINGVEILNYKSDNKIFFGPLDKVSLLNGGSNYDLLKPPTIELSAPVTGSINALIRPVITGSVKDIKIDPQDFKILLSHDPSHWEYEVVNNKMHYQLTLSGHTHGMQFGIEIPGLVKWSPIKWRYKYWAGMYENEGQVLNVNRGFGYLAFPGRVGIWPEITVITLKKGKATV